MEPLLVGLPVVQHTRRFHFDLGKRWSVVEHLVLQGISKNGRSSEYLEEESGLPRRVVIEALIRLMRSGWVEIKAGSKGVIFQATKRGQTVAYYDDLPAQTERKARRISFATDNLTGGVHRRSDLTLIWPNEWVKRAANKASILIDKPEVIQAEAGHIALLLNTLFNEDENLVRVEQTTQKPVDRIALFNVRNGKVEDLSPRSPNGLSETILQAAHQYRSKKEHKYQTAKLESVEKSNDNLRPLRKVQFRRSDLICGGDEHWNLITGILRKARKIALIHSTFIRWDVFNRLLPEIQAAVGRGCRVHILWGKWDKKVGAKEGLEAAKRIRELLDKKGLTGAVIIHRFSTRSHSKILFADDGADGAIGVIGSCNWLYSAYKNFECSVRIRNPHLLADMLFELGEMLRPPDGHLPDLTSDLARWARASLEKPVNAGNTEMQILVGQEHDDKLLQARDTAQKSITVISHKLSNVAKPSVIIPLASAVSERNISANIFYKDLSGGVKSNEGSSVSWEFKEKGVELTAIHRPIIHAKILLWDADNVVVTSQNWLSADTDDKNPRNEIGVAIQSPGMADYIAEKIELAMKFPTSR